MEHMGKVALLSGKKKLLSKELLMDLQSKALRLSTLKPLKELEKWMKERVTGEGEVAMAARYLNKYRG